MNNGTTANAKRLLWAGFFAIFASGVIFSIRSNILLDWSRAYGFTMTELGEISGGGLWGFGLVIIVIAFIAERVGFGVLMVFALVMHILSACLQLSTGWVYEHFQKDGVYWTLLVAQTMMAIANGTCEAVVNPMVAALFPRQKTHYLNILHAGWPGGLVAGAALSYVMNGHSVAGFSIAKVNWLIQMSIFLVPVGVYAVMILGQSFPKSEAGQAGVGFGTMLAQFAHPVLILLLIIHGLVGYVELGTDSWIAKITGAIMKDPGRGTLLLIYTSSLMFLLRFYAGPLEHRLSPLGLLCLSGVLGAIGLTLLGNADSILFCVAAATVYALGKTFLWPTMLAVASERFPKGGSLTIGAMGAAGMLSAGLLGGPGIGFQQDFYATQDLKQKAPEAYDRYAVEKENSFYGIASVKGLDGKKVGLLELDSQERKQIVALDEAKSAEEKKKTAEAIQDTKQEMTKTLEREPELAKWWEKGSPPAKVQASDDAGPIEDAALYGSRMAMKWTAVVPATMAVLYLLLILYFKVGGGYSKVVIDKTAD